MSERALTWLGLLLLLAALVGVMAEAVRFDRTSAERSVRASGSSVRTQGNAAVVDLGNVWMAPAGLVRVVVCPTPQGDPHARLLLEARWGTREATHEEALTEDETRGHRCHEASVRTSVAGWFRARVRFERGLPRAVAPIELFVSRRIRPWNAWPVAAMLIGFVLLGRVRRSRSVALGAIEVAIADDPISPHGAAVRHYPKPARSDKPDGFVGLLIGRPPPVSWPYAWFIAILALAVVLVLTGLAVGMYVVSAKPPQSFLESGTFTLVTLFVQHGLMIVASAWCLGAFGTREVRRALGIVPLERRDVAMAVGLAIALISIAATVTHFIHEESPLGRALEHVPVRYAIGFGALLAPVSEELFFRAVLVPAFGRWHLAVGVIASAVIFTAAHAVQLEGAWLGLVPIAAVGFTNAWLRARTGGITQPWIVHTIYNAVLSAGMYLS